VVINLPFVGVDYGIKSCPCLSCTTKPDTFKIVFIFFSIVVSFVSYM